MEDDNGRASPQPRVGNSRRRRWWALIVGVTAALAAIAVVVIASSGGSSPAIGATQTAETKEIDALLAGIPQSGPSLGPASAPVTLLYFVDLQCLTARTFTLASLPSVIRKWVRPGTVRIEFRSLRSVSEPEAFDTQQAAALAAGIQNKLWYFLEYFYHQQGPEHSGYVNEKYLASLARQVSGLNLAQWNEERTNPELAEEVSRDEQLANAVELNGTPSFVVGRTGSAPIYRMGESSSVGEINHFVQLVLQSQRS